MSIFKRNKKNKRFFHSNAVTRQAGTEADTDQVKIGFKTEGELTDEDIHYFVERDPQGARILAKYSNDPFKKGIEIETENDDFKDEVNNFYKYFLPILEQGLYGAMDDGFCLIFKNFNGDGEPEEPITRAVPFSDDKLLDFSIIRKAQVKEWTRNLDPTSEDHNKIESYVIKVKENDSSGEYEKTIHASRIIHVHFNSPPGKMTGIPLLKPSYNLFVTKYNTEWGAGEAFFRYGAPMNVVGQPEDADDEEFAWATKVFTHLNSKTDVIKPFGYDIDQIGGKIADSKPLTDYLKMALSTMPETVLWGVSAGELTGSETNIQLYYDDIINIQIGNIKPILEVMLRQMEQVGLWDHYDGDFEIVFPPLFELSDEEIAKADSLKSSSARRLMGNSQKGDPPIMTLQEIRDALYPDLDETPTELQEIWDDAYLPEEEEPEPMDAPEQPPGFPQIPPQPPVAPPVNMKLDQLDPQERAELSDRWLYPQLLDNLRMEGKLLPIFAQDVQEFKDMVKTVYKELFPSDMTIQSEKFYCHHEMAMEIKGDYYVCPICDNKMKIDTRLIPQGITPSLPKANQPPQEAIEEFVSRILKIKFNNKQMANAAFKDMDLTFDNAVEFTFEAAEVEAFIVGNPEIAARMRLSANINTSKFYDDVASNVKFQMADGITKGEGIPKLVKRLDDVSTRKGKDLKTMVRTLTKEAAYEARQQTFKDLGVEREIWLSANDERTDEECLDLDGQVFNVGEGPTIPLHFNCRCDYIPEISHPGGW